MSIRSSIKDVKSFSNTIRQKYRQTMNLDQRKKMISTKSRKKIFDQIPNSYKIDIEQSNQKLFNKIQQLQYEIILLKKLVQKNQNDKNLENEKSGKIIELKDRELNKCYYQINELTQQLDYKNREIQCLKLEISQIQRCNNLIKENTLLQAQNPESTGIRNNRSKTLNQQQNKDNIIQKYFVTPFSLSQNKRGKQLNLDDLRVNSISKYKKFD